MSLTVQVSGNTHTYYGRSEHGETEVAFCVDDANRLCVTIDTERVHLESVKPRQADYDNLIALRTDESVMAKYAYGIENETAIKDRIDRLWAGRWEQQDPYSALLAYKRDSEAFLGQVVLGHGEVPGESELAYLFHKEHWHQGYGTEVVRATVEEYAPATVCEGFALRGEPLKRITATARTDNPYSIAILKKIGMSFVAQQEKYDGMRNYYAMPCPKKVILQKV